MMKVRPLSDSPHQGVISPNTPEYQYPWVQFYRAFKFHWMAAIFTEPLLPSSLPSSSDGAAIGLAIALEATTCNGDKVDAGFATA
jgi:hypothetical protein